MPYAHDKPSGRDDDTAECRSDEPAPFHMTWLSAAAGAMSSSPTRFGVIAARVGIVIDMNAALSAAAT